MANELPNLFIEAQEVELLYYAGRQTGLLNHSLSSFTQIPLLFEVISKNNI